MSDLRSVLYRQGPLTLVDYQEAIEELQAASRQMEPDGNACAVCTDGGHQAFECHHNVLRMARKLVAESAAEKAKWRCFHCSEQFTDYDEAREHFGLRNSMVVPMCVRPAVCPVTLLTCLIQLGQSRSEHALLHSSATLEAATAEVHRLKEAIRKHRDTWMRPGADEELYAALREESHG